MKHTICFIDDKIPVSQYSQYFKDTDMINESVLNFLLKNEDTFWGDVVVKKMCNKLLDESEKWSVCAFTTPIFYENYIEETVYAPEIIIYDWDYNAGAASDDSEEYLLSILKSSYTMVFIFSEQDNIDNINEIVCKDEFVKFGDRLNVIDKNEDGSVESIFSIIEKKENNNFSFKYGHDIIYNSNKAINKILSDISQLSIEEFCASIGECKDEKYYVTNNDFIDVVIPRYRRALYNINSVELFIKKESAPNIEEIKRVWSYRLYDDTYSNEVSMGDIVKKENGGYFLVVSSDCHMNRFWKKNGGFISMIPLNRTNSNIGKYQRKLMMNNSMKITSLTNSQIAMTILPAVPISQRELRNFIVFPKNILSIKIDKPENNTAALTYENFKGYSKVVSVMDPFKYPLIHFIMNNITGYGCPDFPQDFQTYLTDKIKNK